MENNNFEEKAYSVSKGLLSPKDLNKSINTSNTESAKAYREGRKYSTIVAGVSLFVGGCLAVYNIWTNHNVRKVLNKDITYDPPVRNRKRNDGGRR